MARTRRTRTTRRSVVVVERLARLAITLGGMGTIVAVSTIFLFLAWVVVPLFVSPQIEGRESFASRDAEVAPFRMGVDEERLLAWTLHRDGALELTDLATGTRIDLRRPFGDDVPTAASFSLDSADHSADTPNVAVGFANGSVRLGRIGFESRILLGEEEPEALEGLKTGAATLHEGGVVERTSVGQLRFTELVVELEEPLATGASSPIVELDHAVPPQGVYLVALHEDQTLRVSRVKEKPNLMTGTVTKKLSHSVLARSALSKSREAPMRIAMGGLGQHVFVLWEDGLVAHWSMATFSQPVLFEEVDLVPGDATVTAFDFIAGKRTLLVGDSEGTLTSWFTARQGGEDSPKLLQRARDFLDGGPPVRALAASPRSRVFAAGDSEGVVRVFQASLGDELFTLEDEAPSLALVMPPKQDAVLSRSAERITTWEIDLGYPEATLTALFRPIHYENYAVPTHKWQSSSMSDDSEPKLGMLPLVFGTIKATFYSMLFGGPLAILAAIFTSEFLSPRLRAPIKSIVELMASLPSVVLGFIAAFVIAPFVHDWLAVVLLSFVTVPAATLGGAYLWQLLPAQTSIRLTGLPRFLAIGATLPAGMLVAWLLSVPFESLFFAGDMEAWLDGQVGGAFGGLFFLLLPVAGLVVALVAGALVNPAVRRRSSGWNRKKVARGELLKFVVGGAVVLGVAALLAVSAAGTGFDPRGHVMGTYIQRNAMVVGFAMGFAIIPIIYTLAEDALSEVPSQLREGSLGAGATLWQTAVRIVLPFAMSGIFSALMIGLGRAVGETMIVLMAVGNTPIMDWNVFNGFRTLSANIATELPEAVRHSAHYRALFLAGLVLFAMTFVLNTFAELVRRHFRKRMQAL